MFQIPLLHSKDIRKDQDLILLQCICHFFFRCKSVYMITDDTVKFVTNEHRDRSIHRTLHSKIKKTGYGEKSSQ